MTQLNSFGQSLAETLAWSRAQAASWQSAHQEDPKVHVASAGKTLTAAYEQLRNAAEYAEEHWLLQRAISRFYKRKFLARDSKVAGESAEELILELTLAGYLQNDSVPVAVLEHIDTAARKYYEVYEQLPAEYRDQANSWTIDMLAVMVEKMLSDHSKQDGFAQFAHDYYSKTLDPSEAVGDTAPDDYTLSLFIAVSQALLKTDAAAVRADILSRYKVEPAVSSEFISINQRIDALLVADTTDRLTRAIDKRGGPLRILWRMIDTREDIERLLEKPSTFLSAYESQIEQEYRLVGKKVRRGVFKGIIFLIVTKLVIGVAIEIPYDKIFHGEILWLPLIINLFFPPLYMMLLSTMMSVPGAANTRALSKQMENILYGNEPGRVLLGRNKKSFSAAFSVVYALLFLVVFGGATWLLVRFGEFSLLHLAIFFVFLSTASFLGHRLTRIVREVEVVDADQNGLTIGRDMLYMPFVVVGHWISDKYSKVNIMTLVLDMAIELPLKTFLHLVRQWTAFISSKKDEL